LKIDELFGVDGYGVIVTGGASGIRHEGAGAVPGVTGLVLCDRAADLDRWRLVARRGGLNQLRGVQRAGRPFPVSQRTGTDESPAPRGLSERRIQSDFVFLIVTGRSWLPCAFFHQVGRAVDRADRFYSEGAQALQKLREDFVLA
jgi:hypothetical protein